MASNRTVTSKTSHPDKPVFEQDPNKIEGFDFERIIELSPFPSGVGRLLKYACNLAASTDNFVIYKSQQTLADDAGCSVSTVQRTYRIAVSLGILSVTAVYDAKTRARKANMYQFSAKALTYVRNCLTLLRKENVKPSGSQKRIRGIVAKAFALFDFSPVTPRQKEVLPPCQNDVQEVRDLSTKREILNGPDNFEDNSDLKKPAEAVPVTTHSEVIATLAAGVSRASNARQAEKHETERLQKESLLGQLFGKPKPKTERRRSRNLPCADIVPDFGFHPPGFRGGDEPAGENANATATLSVRREPEPV